MRALTRYATGVAVAVTPVAVAADTTEVDLYGSIHAAVSYYESDEQRSATTLNDDKGRTRIGIGIRHDLGVGLDAVGRLEGAVDPTDPGDSDTTRRRELFVGLEGDMGRISAGRFNSAYKQTGGISWDMMYATDLQQRRSGGMSGGKFGHNDFLSNVVEYRTVGDGLGAIVQFSVDETTRDEGSRAGDHSIALFYKGREWEFISAYSKDKQASESEDYNLKLGLRYEFGGFSLAYQEEWVSIQDRIDHTEVVADPDGGRDITTDTDIGFITDDTRHRFIGLSYAVDRQVWWLAYGRMRARQDDADIDSYTLALNHYYSPNVRAYIGAQYQERERAYPSRDLTILSTGLRFDF